MSDPMPPKLIDDMVRRGAMRTMELARDTDMWDVAPMLGLVAAGADNEPQCIHVPVPDSMWRDAHPAAVLDAMTAAVQYGLISLQLAEPYKTDVILGVMLITEGHAVDMEALTDAERATFDDFKATRRLERHPKSRELRMAQMIDRSLTTAIIRHFRGDPVSEQVVYGVTGTIPDALTRFVTAVMAAWISDAEKTT